MEDRALKAQPRMGRFAFAMAGVLCVSAFSASANPNGPYAVTAIPSEYIPVSTLYRGATVYGTGKPVSVRFVHSIADWGHHLFLMDNKSGAEKPLMIYRGNGRGNLCPDSGGVRAELGVFDSTQELVFMLRSISTNDYAGRYCTGEACGPRYTGLNNPAKSRFYSRGEFSHMAGHIWAEAARITAKQADSLPLPCPGATPAAGEEGILISFNDGANVTFGDLVIQVIGVQMDVERTGLPGPIADTVPPEALPVKCAIAARTGGVTRGEDLSAPGHGQARFRHRPPGRADPDGYFPGSGLAEPGSPPTGRDPFPQRPGHPGRYPGSLRVQPQLLHQPWRIREPGAGRGDGGNAAQPESGDGRQAKRFPDVVSRQPRRQYGFHGRLRGAGLVPDPAQGESHRTGPPRGIVPGGALQPAFNVRIHPTLAPRCIHGEYGLSFPSRP